MVAYSVVNKGKDKEPLHIIHMSNTYKTMQKILDVYKEPLHIILMSNTYKTMQKVLDVYKEPLHIILMSNTYKTMQKNIGWPLAFARIGI